MSARLVLFIQSLALFIVGIYLSSQGLPSDEIEIATDTGNMMLDAIDDASDSPQVQETISSTKQTFKILGTGATIISILELIGLGASLFFDR